MSFISFSYFSLCAFTLSGWPVQAGTTASCRCCRRASAEPASHPSLCRSTFASFRVEFLCNGRSTRPPRSPCTTSKATCLVGRVAPWSPSCATGSEPGSNARGPSATSGCHRLRRWPRPSTRKRLSTGRLTHPSFGRFATATGGSLCGRGEASEGPEAGCTSAGSSRCGSRSRFSPHGDQARTSRTCWCGAAQLLASRGCP